MKILETLKRKGMQETARSRGKWYTQAMLYGFGSIAECHKGDARTGWLAGKALLARNYWSQVGETGFYFDRSGSTIQIPHDMTLMEVIHLLINVEFGYALSKKKRLSDFEREQLLRLAHAEAERFADGTEFRLFPAASSVGD